MEDDDIITYRDVVTADKKSCTFDLRSGILCPMRGARVLILSGRFKGAEGICLGKNRDERWAISPDGSNEILSLVRDTEFALLVDLSANPVVN
jgi:hypothetical protein